jgi:hypothetical protein
MGNITQKKFKDFSFIEKIGSVAGLGIISYAFYSFVIKQRSNVAKAPVDYGQIPEVYTAGGKPVLWDPDPLSKEIFENIEGYNWNTYPETTDKITKLNNDQLKLLYNHYNTYYAQEFPTLTKLIDAEWSDYNGSYTRAVAKLKSAGLN